MRGKEKGIELRKKKKKGKDAKKTIVKRRKG